MKKTFQSMIDQADSNQLEPFFDNLEDEAVPKDAVSRIRPKVLGRDASGKAGNSVRRWIPALSAAACLILAAGIFVWAGLAGRKTPAVPPEGEGVSSKEAGGSSEGDPVSPGESGDTFLSEPLPADGPASGIAAERDTYFGIRFYVRNGAAYMFYKEGEPVYRYENGSLVQTRIRPDEQQFFSDGYYGDYAYVGGMFHCCGGNESGLFRVDLSTGGIEKIVDCAEVVSSVVAEGSKIYYSTHTGYETVPTARTYSLKCADLEKREITEILSGVEYKVSSLKMSDGKLFFNSYGYDGVRCLFPDGTLRSVSNGYSWDYTVNNDIVYTYTQSQDETDDVIYTVCAYNLQGERIGFSETRESAEESDGHRRKKRYYLGSLLDGITVFDGRVVFFDDQGVWLEDLADGSTEKILDDPFGFEDPYRYRYVGKTVFDGKLFLCWSDENWTDRLIIYDSGEVRQMTLG